MSLTISELESERAKILDEIESKASNISKKSPSNSSEGSMSLNDWLTAAEEVMPEKPKSKQKPNYSNKMLNTTKGSNRSSFFGVVIMLSLLLTILGVVYMAYTSIHKELQSVMSVKEDSVTQMKALQDEMKSLQEAVATGGKPEAFIHLEDKVLLLESELNNLKSQMAELASKPQTVDSNNAETSEQATAVKLSSQSSDSQANNNGIVTEEILDKKLKTYTQQLEQKIDRKLEIILNHLKQGRAVNAAELSSLDNSESSQVTNKASEEELNIETPTVATVSTPVVEAPLLKLVKKVEKPEAPKAPDAPIISASADVKWLISQPNQHYILQLASMPEEASLKKIANAKQLKDVRIVPQTRKGVTNYVLLTGSFVEKSKANELAKKIKSETGISPWIRKVKDLSGRIQ